jgi:hypothetical protein
MDEWQEGMWVDRKGSVRGGDHDAPARSDQFMDELALLASVPYMLHHGVGESDIELVVFERQIAPVGNDDLNLRERLRELWSVS